MQGEVAAIARWRRLDGEGDDVCRLVREPGGWMLAGHARFAKGGVRSALDYVVWCDEGWHSLRADVSGRHDGATVGWRIRRNGSGWLLNDRPADGDRAEGCTDIDLAFTPATNLLPLRRLRPRDGEIAVRAVWFPFPETCLRPLPQSYRRDGPGQVVYTSPDTGFSARLNVHDTGFVTLYPGLWEGEVAQDD
ncbi:MAG: putative glycolipid-binding domain-containing protein [Tranquillimonas sp.]|jgi:hypothetical protein